MEGCYNHIALISNELIKNGSDTEIEYNRIMLWVKAFHILFFTSWMAGIFYLPRIFVHHAEALKEGQDVRRLVIMEFRLFRFMSIISMLALGFGLWLWLGYGITGGWMHAKLVFVGLLMIYHWLCYVFMRDFQRGKIRPGVFYRIFNEFSLLIFIPIIYFAVLKPF